LSVGAKRPLVARESGAPRQFCGAERVPCPEEGPQLSERSEVASPLVVYEVVEVVAAVPAEGAP
jgi:hypothetical protein